ncbi:MAG: hypothetical protein RRB22_02635 [Gammaproteobacteria bacterium]|nr:hypothetical protein [Gammaproteobacteria bacterium]
MKTGKMMNAVLGAVLLMGGVALSNVQAATVAYEDVGFIRGVGYESDVFTVSSSGNYRVKLTDFSFPDYFEELELTITTNNTVINSLSGSGWFDFEADVGIQYFANVYGVAAGSLNLGLYGIGVEALNTPVSSVPIPASLLLMSSALVVLGGFGRGGRKADEQETLSDEALPA